MGYDCYPMGMEGEGYDGDEGVSGEMNAEAGGAGN
jgi:hypothetical protein